MEVGATRELGSPVVDVVAVGDELLVTTEAQVAILDRTLATVRMLRESDDDLMPAGIAAIADGAAVLVGWESVVALDLATGEERWGIYDGDHSLDENVGDCLAYVPPYAVLRNGGAVDVRDGEYLAFDAGPGEHRCLLAELDAIVLARYEGPVVRWTPAGSIELARFASPVIALARAANDELVVACADGSVHLADRCLREPWVGQGEYAGAAIAAGPGIAVLHEVQGRDYRRRWELHVDGERRGTGESAQHGLTAALWIGGELAIVTGGVLHASDIGNVSIVRPVGDALVVGTSSGRLSLLAASDR